MNLIMIIIIIEEGKEGDEEELKEDETAYTVLGNNRPT